MDWASLVAVAATSSVIPSFVAIVRSYIKARHADTSVTIKVGDREITIKRDNTEEAEELIRTLLDSIDSPEPGKPGIDK